MMCNKPTEKNMGALLVLMMSACASFSDPIDKTWRSYLDAPPPKAVALALNLTRRADAVAASGTDRVPMPLGFYAFLAES